MSNKINKYNPKKSLGSGFLFRVLSDGRNSQKGTVLFTAIALGILAIGGATLAISKANSDKVNASSDQKAKQALGITEAGVSKSISTLSNPQFRYLMMMNYDSTAAQTNRWSVPSGLIPANSTPAVSPPANPCDYSDENGDGQYNLIDYLTKLKEAENDINNNNTFATAANGTTGNGPSDGTYETISYEFDGDAVNGGTGTLRVRGRLNSNNNDKARYQVVFNVQPTPTPSASGGGAAALLATTMDLKKLNAYANTVICTTPAGCPIPANSCASGQTSLDPNNTSDYAKLKLALRLDATNGILARTTANVADKSNVQILSSTVPPVPIAQTGNKIFTLNYTTGALTSQLMASIPNTNNQNIASVNFSELLSNVDFAKFWQWIDNPVSAAPPANNGNGGGGNVGSRTITPSTATGDYTTDVNGNKIWFYQVNNWGGNQDDLYVNVANVGENDQVRIYVNNNISFNGNTELLPINNSNGNTNSGNVVLAKAKTIRLMGGNANGTALTNPQVWDIGGTSCIVGHIHAPNASFDISNGNGCSVVSGISGLGNSNPNVYGAIWAKAITNNTGNSSIFFENVPLTQRLAIEYQNTSYNVTGAAGRSVAMNVNSRFEQTRQADN